MQPPVQEPEPEAPEGPVYPNLIYNILANTVFFMIIAFAIYKLIPVFRYLINVFKIKVLFEGAEIQEYIEESEIIQETDNSRKMVKIKKMVKSMKKDILQTNDPVEKVRSIYKTIMYMLGSMIEINKSDTTNEILEKSLNISGMNTYLKPVTEIYNYARYGEYVPLSKDVSQVEENYLEIENKLKND